MAMAEAERYQHYEVLRRDDGSLWELGRGAMGITYKAFDTNLRCPVALKVINSTYLNSEVARQRFLREARAAAALRHQNVASVFHLGQDHESYFYAMEFIDGETVDAYMKHEGRLPPAEALGITLQVTRALAAAAKQQLVHRDLKPTNLMLVDEEGERVVKVIDFGLAKSAKREGEDSGTLTVGGGFVGTPHFASPEQLEERDIDIRSDIYSLGATLYYMLAGHPPFSGSVAQIMSQHLYKPLPEAPLAGQPPYVIELLRKMMEKDRAKRPQTPIDLRQDIIQCLERLQGTGVFTSTGPIPSVGQPETLATIAFGSTDPNQLKTDSILAQRYSITHDLGDSPQGRQFTALDLRTGRRIALLLLSPEFVSDTKRYTALEQEIDRLRRAPHPSLREVYSLESVANRSFLTEEQVEGAQLTDLLRARSLLTPIEAVRLAELLAPVADHARAHGLQQVDLTLSGVRLVSPGLAPGNAELLRRPLTEWPETAVKVSSVDFSSVQTDSATWAGGGATLVQPHAGSGPRGSYLSMLTLLIYELLGGPRSTVESSGRYTPLASLSEQGNAVLRRGLIDDLPSATEMARLLGNEIGFVGRDFRSQSQVTIPVGPKPASTYSPGGSPVIPPPLPDTNKGPAVLTTQRPDAPPPVQPALTPPPPKKPRFSIAGLILIVGLSILFLGALSVAGTYLYQYLTRTQERITQTSPSPAPSIAQNTPQPIGSPEASEPPIVQHTPPSKPTPQGSTTPSPVQGGESYEKGLAAARQLRKKRDFEAALKAYMELSDRNPDKQAEIQKEMQEMLAEEVQSLPSPSNTGPTPQPTGPPPSDSYSEQLAAAQQLVRNGDWHGALRDYLNLMDRYPDRPEAAKRLDNLLAETRTSEGKIDATTFAAAKPQLVRAAEKGVIPAMLLLGQFTRETDPSTALSWYEKAAEKGNVPAMVEAGLIYGNRGGETKALEYFVRAAEAGDRDGKYLAGECYYHGKGTAVNYEKAVEYLQQAAALNESRAMDVLGDYYRKTGHFDQARKYFEDAVGLGYARSYSNLGVMYMNGDGVAKNPEVATNLFRQGADKGDPEGMFFYAVSLWQGIGVPKDTKSAVNWARRSAKAGFSPAKDWCTKNKISF
jgi:serine/threonine protein kinase/Flp pilus assembly protein TadD